MPSLRKIVPAILAVICGILAVAVLYTLVTREDRPPIKFTPATRAPYVSSPSADPRADPGASPSATAPVPSGRSADGKP